MPEQNLSSIDMSWTQLPLSLEILLISPELVNFVLLMFGIYGMYQGIEVQHPLYTVLFLNLTFAWLSSFINVAAFSFVIDGAYLRLANTTSTLALYFHTICWFMTTVIRYLYIVHDAWLHKKVPNVKVQCIIALGSVFALTMALASPTFGYALSLGAML